MQIIINIRSKCFEHMDLLNQNDPHSLFESFGCACVGLCLSN